MLLVPRDPSDDKDAILEIKAGEGGDESALFAGDLLKMYLKYAESQNWKTEVHRLGRVRPGRVQVDHGRREGEGHARAGRGAVREAEVRGWRAPRAAGAGDRVAGPDPHRRGRCPGAAGGRGRRRRDRPERPADRRVPLVRSGWAERQHDRLRRPDHPPADRHRGLDAEREVPAAEPRAGDARAAVPAARRGPGGCRPGGVRRSPAADPDRRPLRARPHLQLPGEPVLRPPGRLQGAQPGPGARRRARPGDPGADRGRPDRAARGRRAPSEAR